jgi:hypothetical protein
MGQGKSKAVSLDATRTLDLKCIREGETIKTPQRVLTTRANRFLDFCRIRKNGAVELCAEYALEDIFGAENMLRALHFILKVDNLVIEADTLSVESLLYLCFLEVPLEGLELVTLQRLKEEKVPAHDLVYLTLGKFGNKDQHRSLDGFLHLKHFIVVHLMFDDWASFIADMEGCSRLGLDLFQEITSKYALIYTHNQDNVLSPDFCASKEEFEVFQAGRAPQDLVFKSDCY